MKKAAPFTGFSERQRSEIKKTLPRGALTDGLMDRCEQHCREYASISLSSDPDLLKFLVAKEKLVAEFRREVIEAGQLPPELQQGAAEWVGKIERYYQQSKAAELGRGAGVPTQSIEVRPDYLSISHRTVRPQNAQDAALDSLVESLFYEWVYITGDWPAAWNNKVTRAFIGACVRPVARRKSTSERAIGERLYRMEKRQRRMDADFDRVFAPEVARMYKILPDRGR